jgi:hypothetical protein
MNSAAYQDEAKHHRKGPNYWKLYAVCLDGLAN